MLPQVKVILKGVCKGVSFPLGSLLPTLWGNVLRYFLVQLLSLSLSFSLLAEINVCFFIFSFSYTKGSTLCVLFQTLPFSLNSIFRKLLFISSERVLILFHSCIVLRCTHVPQFIQPVSNLVAFRQFPMLLQLQITLQSVVVCIYIFVLLGVCLQIYPQKQDYWVKRYRHSTAQELYHLEFPLAMDEYWFPYSLPNRMNGQAFESLLK